jgi:hypothetical protein
MSPEYLACCIHRTPSTGHSAASGARTPPDMPLDAAHSRSVRATPPRPACYPTLSTLSTLRCCRKSRPAGPISPLTRNAIALPARPLCRGPFPLTARSHLRPVPAYGPFRLTARSDLRPVPTYGPFPLTARSHLRPVPTYGPFPFTARSHLQPTVPSLGRRRPPGLFL